MTVRNYIIGLIASVALTLVAYVAVVEQLASGLTLLLIIGALALVQMVVQLVYFLHLPEEIKPRYKLISFGFMAVILLIIVVGSLWIMHHMNYNMMELTPTQKDDIMNVERNKGF